VKTAVSMTLCFGFEVVELVFDHIADADQPGEVSILQYGKMPYAMTGEESHRSL
jgi:hypothetical protein